MIKLVNFVDTFYGGKISTDGPAALSLSFPIFLILLSLGMGISSGAGRVDRVKQAFNTSLVYGVFIMVGVLTPVIIFARPLMRVFTADPEVIRMGIAYIYIGLPEKTFMRLFAAGACP